jgi:hypothetical protein
MANLIRVEYQRPSQYGTRMSSINTSPQGENYLYRTDKDNGLLIVQSRTQLMNLASMIGSSAGIASFNGQPIKIKVVLNHPALYIGKTIKTDSETEYTIDSDLKIHGRKEIDGAKIEKIAGLSPQNYEVGRRYMGQNHTEPLNALMDNLGCQLQSGLHMLVSIQNQDIPRFKRIGTLTSRIISIK